MTMSQQTSPMDSILYHQSLPLAVMIAETQEHDAPISDSPVRPHPLYPPPGRSLAGGGSEGIDGRGEDRRGDGIGNGVRLVNGLVVATGNSSVESVFGNCPVN